VTNTRYELTVLDLSIGARVLVYPHPRMFIGLGLHEVFTQEKASPALFSSSFHQSTGEVVGGCTVAKIQALSIQVIAAAGTYDRFDGLENVTWASLAVGVSR